ncbi:DUF4012 domain-containing protein [Streptomyces sp. NPDC001156]
MTEQGIRMAEARRPGTGRDAVAMPGSGGSGERAPHRPRALRIALLAAVLIPLACAVWVGITGLFARQELLAAQRDLDALRHSLSPKAASGAATASPSQRLRLVRSAAVHAARARRLTSGPAWDATAEVPYFGSPVTSMSGTAHAVDRLTRRVLTPLIGVLPASAPGGSGGGMAQAVAALQQYTPYLARAADVTAGVRAQVDALPHSTWLPEADRARTGLKQQLDHLAPVMTDVSLAARVLPPMLGMQGERRYFLAFQNPAEARGTGGLPGAFAVLRADRGRLSFERFGSTEMAKVKSAVDLGSEFKAQYRASNPTKVWANSNMSPHFPYAARIWAAAWQKHTGEDVDGAIAVDPVVLSRLLRVTGPVRMADGTKLTADNVVDLTERSGYAEYQDVIKRRDFFVDAARGAAGGVLGALDDARRLPALLVAVDDVQRDGRLKVWSAHEEEQSLIQSRPLAGTLPETAGPFAGLVVNNKAGGKLDYYLDRSLAWEAGGCAAGGRPVTVTVTLANRAPTAGLPASVTMRSDYPLYRTRPGDNRLLVSYYAGVGAALSSATLDGRPALLAPGIERGHSVFTLDLELPAGSQRTLVLHLREPSAEGTPTLLRQPLATPLRAMLKPGVGCYV